MSRHLNRRHLAAHLSLLRLALLSTLCLFVGVGCASVMSGAYQNIQVNSAPSGATVSVGHIRYGTTPISIDINRRKPEAVRVELDGYRAKSLVFERRLNPWLLGNILLGGIVGLGVDMIGGSVYCLSPDEVTIFFKEPHGVPESSAKVYSNKEKKE